MTVTTEKKLYLTNLIDKAYDEYRNPTVDDYQSALFGGHFTFGSTPAHDRLAELLQTSDVIETLYELTHPF